MRDISGIDLLGFDRILRRGTGKVLEESENVLFLYDTVSKAYFLSCEDIAAGISILDRYAGEDLRLLSVTDIDLGRAVFQRYGFCDKLECYQAAWYGKAPEPAPELSVRTAGREDLPLLIKTYDLISPEEMEQVVERGCLLFGYHREQPVGFIGEHLEGSMGLLYGRPWRKALFFSVRWKRIIRPRWIFRKRSG